MYCVIQKIFNKNIKYHGEAKELKVSTGSFTIDGKSYYRYEFTGGYFERTHKEAYKISIHKSYREKGQVKKKQWVICTIPYYSIADDFTWAGDFTIGLTNKLKEIGITEDQLWDMVYEKLQPIIDNITKEFKRTEEYKAKKKHEAVLKKYREAKECFEKKYGSSTYDYCYDIFGVLRNKEYLEELKKNYETQQKYYENFSSYYNNQSNYSDNDFSSYFKSSQSNYTDEEKSMLKNIYKTLALKYHPDKPEGDAEMMKLVNKLKESWGI